MMIFISLQLNPRQFGLFLVFFLALVKARGSVFGHERVYIAEFGLNLKVSHVGERKRAIDYYCNHVFPLLHPAWDAVSLGHRPVFRYFVLSMKSAAFCAALAAVITSLESPRSTLSHAAI